VKKWPENLIKKKYKEINVVPYIIKGNVKIG
jgi:hypothetical protein